MPLVWHVICCAEMDGDQILIFFGLIRSQLRKGLYQGHVSRGIYTRDMSGGHLSVDLKSESGLVFQSVQYVDKYSSPLLLLFYADKSYSGKHRTHHPIYSKLFICFPWYFRVISESSNTLLCINLSFRSQPTRRRAAEAWELDPNWMDAMFWWQKGKDFEARTRLWVMQC